MCASPPSLAPEDKYCGRGAPMNVVCAECMKMCSLGGKNSVLTGYLYI